MTELLLEALSRGALRHAEARLSPGTHVILGDDTRALAELIALAGGVVSPEGGRVTLDGATLVRAPAARRTVATLLAEETLPFARSVEQSVSYVLEARGDTKNARDLLASYELERFGARAPTDLDWDERRSLGLALALAHEQARVLALYEPFSTSLLADADVTNGVARAVARGAIVLLATTSLALAEELGKASWWVGAGMLRAVVPVAPVASVAPLTSAASAEIAEEPHFIPPVRPPAGARPADQRVSMPTSFADPTRPNGSDRGGGT